MHRPTVGILALLLLALAIALLFLPPGYEDAVTTWQSPLVRVGMLLAVVWLAHPQLKNFPYWVLLVGGGICILLITAMKPRVLVLVILVGILLLKLRPTPEKAKGKAGS